MIQTQEPRVEVEFAENPDEQRIVELLRKWTAIFRQMEAEQSADRAA